MAKYKHVAVTAAAKQAGQVQVAVAFGGLTGHALTALEHDAARVVAKLAEIQPERSLQLVSTGGNFQAVIKHGRTTFQLEGRGEDSSFAVSTHD